MANDPDQRPKKLPSGSRKIEDTGWSGDHQEIKEGIGAGPTDKTSISPDGDVWVKTLTAAGLITGLQATIQVRQNQVVEKVSTGKDHGDAISGN